MFMRLKILFISITWAVYSYKTLKFMKCVNFFFTFPDIITMAVNSNLGYSVEKSISQCYHLLSILSSLWRDILPSTVYCKFIGKFLIYLC